MSTFAAASRYRMVRGWPVVLLAIAVVVGAALGVMGAPEAPNRPSSDVARPSQSALAHMATAQNGGSDSKTLATAPPSLRQAVEREEQFDNRPQLTAEYSNDGAEFSAGKTHFTVGLATAGREGSEVEQVANSITRRTAAASFGTAVLSESFHPSAGGIEQTFRVRQKPAGSGHLTLQIPLNGATAARSGSAIDIEGEPGHVAATYSGLRVTDSHGVVLQSSMRTRDAGTSIEISVNDARATYPLTIDPTWTEAEEFTCSGGCTQFGYFVAIDGTTAFVTIASVGVDVFTESGGLWTYASQLTVSTPDCFGYSLAASGSTLVVGDPRTWCAGGTDAVYVYTGSGSSWTQRAEVDSPASGAAFGTSVAISGTSLVVGAPLQTIGSNTEQGAAYLYTGSGSSWSETATFIAADGTTADELGSAVTTTGSTVAVGAPDKYFGYGVYGAVYFFNGPSWTQSGEFTDPDTSETGLGTSLASEGNEVLVGAPVATVGTDYGLGEVRVYTESGGSWTLATTIDGPDPTSTGSFGSTLSLSGSTLIVGATPGAYYSEFFSFSGFGSSWTETAGPIEPSDYQTDDSFNQSVATNGSIVLLGAPYHDPPGGASNQGAVWSFDAPGVTPQGSTTYGGPELYAGGPPSEACQSCNSPVPAQHSSGDPIDTATGDFSESATDLNLPGAGIPLDFTRTYDAQEAQAQAGSSSVPPLGYGWTDNFNMAVISSGTTATVTEENGAQSSYDYDSSRAWCPSTSTYNFCAADPRIQAELNHNSDGTWTFVRATGAPETFTFNSSGVLTEMADANGDSLSSLSYSPGGGQTSCPSGDTCTAWTSSASGRELVLATNGSGQLVEVFDANSSLAAIFAYSGTGCSSWSGSEVPDLCSVTDPGGMTSTFTYDSGNSMAAFDYDMLSATPPSASGQVENEYNSMGQIEQQIDPTGNDTTSYVYSGTSSSPAGGTTTVTNYPDGTGTGEPQDVTFDVYSSNTLIGQTTGYGTANEVTTTITRDSASLLPVAVSDGNNNATTYTYQTYSGSGGTDVSSANVLTSTDALNNTTQHEYTATNQVWCTVDAADYANAKRCPSTEPTSPPAPGASDPNLGMTIAFYNSSDLVTATTDALGNTTTYSFTNGVTGVPSGLLYCAVDPVDYQSRSAAPPTAPPTSPARRRRPTTRRATRPPRPTPRAPPPPTRTPTGRRTPAWCRRRPTPTARLRPTPTTAPASPPITL